MKPTPPQTSAKRSFCAVALGGAALMAIMPASLSAQEDTDGIGNSPMISKLETCMQIADDAERLACFDREVGELVGATNDGEVRVVETEEITEARRKLFGFSVPDVGLFSGGDDDASDLLQSTITRVQKVGRNEWHFWIEEGNAKWRMKNNSIRARAPKVSDSVEFKRATLGTYWIRVNGRKGVRGNRIG